MSMVDELEEIYTKSDVAYTGQYAIYKQAKAKGVPGVTLKKVRQFLNSKSGWIQQYKFPKKFRRAKVFASDVNDLWSADVTYLTSNKMPRKNRNYKYLLTVIDCLSKKAYVRILKRKSGPAVHDAFRNLLETVSPISPRHLRTDRGKEFKNSMFKDMCKEYKINHYFAGNIVKASLVERFNRTLKDALFEGMKNNGSFKWLDNNLLNDIVAQYNNRIHSTTSLAPNQVSSSDVPHLLHKIYSLPWKTQSSARFRLLLGDRVFVVKTALSGSKGGQHGAFVKGQEDVFSAEQFTVSRRIGSRPPRYQLTDQKNRGVEGRYTLLPPATFETPQGQRAPSLAMNNSTQPRTLILTNKSARRGSASSFVCEINPPLEVLENTKLALLGVTISNLSDVSSKIPLALNLDVIEDRVASDHRLRKTLAVFRPDACNFQPLRAGKMSSTLISRISVELKEAGNPGQVAFHKESDPNDVVVVVELITIPPANSSPGQIKQTDSRRYAGKIILAPSHHATCHLSLDAIDC